MRLSEASRLYDASSRLDLHEHIIAPPLLRALEWAIRDLRDANAEAEEDPVWRDFWVPILRYRRNAYATGLPLNRAELLPSEDADRYSRATSSVERRYTQYSRKLATLRGAFEACRVSPTSPIADRVVELLHGLVAADIGIFMDNENLRGATEVLLRDRLGCDGFRVLRKGQLRDVSIGGTLFVIGPLERFPVSLTLAPRASSLHVIRYEWSRSTRCDASLLPEGRGSPVNLCERTSPIPMRSLSETGNLSLVIDPKRLSFVLSRFGDEADVADSDASPRASDHVKVRLVRLAAGKCIFLESGSRVRVLEIPGPSGAYALPGENDGDGDSESPTDSAADATLGLATHMAEVDRLVPGLFLVERVGGGGASIDLIARHLQGSERKQLEQIQSKWKQRLKNAIQNRGLSSIADELSGQFPASPSNLRNWAGGDVFLPEDFPVFKALLEFLGLGRDAEFFWDVGRSLQSMNRNAGRAVSARLLRALAEHVNSAELVRRGSIELELKGFRGSGLLVSRVEDVSFEELLIPRGRARRLFDEDLLETSIEA